MAAETPRFHHTNALFKEITTVPKTVALWARYHWKEVTSSLILAAGGIYGLHAVITGTGNADLNESSKSGAAEPKRSSQNELGITLTTTPSKPVATITPVPVGSETNAPESRYNALITKISQGQASEAEIREFNNFSEKQNTVTTWLTEKGEIRQLPQIEGLRVVNRVFDRDRGLEIVYVTKENNRFNLKEGQVAGIFNPNVFDVDIKNSKEVKNQIGSVGLRAEVLKSLLQDKQSPSINIWLPIFVDATLPSTNGDRTILIQESKMPSGKEIIALRAPIGSKLVLGLHNNQGESEIGFRPASTNGGLIAIRSPRILDRFELYFHYYGTFQKNDVKSSIGNDLLEISKRPFSDEIAEAGVAKFVPPIFNSVNLYMYAQQSYSEKNGDFPEFPLGKKGLAKIDDSYITAMSKTNPLLTSSR